MADGAFFSKLFAVHPFAGLQAEDYPEDSQNFFYDADVFEDMIALTRPELIIEIGTWKGHSANAMMDICKRRELATRIICVDTWLGSQEHYLDDAWREALHVEHGRPTLWERFIGNTIRRANQDAIYPLPLTASTAAHVLTAMGVKAHLVYIDGSHEYQDVIADISHYHPLLEPSGLLFGDDFSYPPVAEAVRDFAGRHCLNIARKGGKWLLLRDPARIRDLQGYGLEPPPGAALQAVAPPPSPAMLRQQASSGMSGDESDSGMVAEAPRGSHHRAVLSRETGLCLAPVLHDAVDDQDHRLLRSLLGGQKHARPDVSSYLLRLDDAYFAIGPGVDGVIFTQEGVPVPQTCSFVDRDRLPGPEQIRADAIHLDRSVFISIEQAWRNYYHWLCIALPKMMMARHIDGISFTIAVPDYLERQRLGWTIGFSQAVWEQSLHMADLAGSYVPLPSGIYRAKSVCTILIDNMQPAFLSLTRDFAACFETIRQKLTFSATAPRRIYVKRQHDPRLTEQQTEFVERCLYEAGFVTCVLEGMDFIGQAALFHNAEIVVGAHGAGLSNILFGRRGLKVFELNSLIGDATHLRPWFYMLAAGQGQDYFYLNASNPKEFTEANFRQALTRATSRLPLAGSTAPWWRWPR